jgi:hypothetical protein
MSLFVEIGKVSLTRRFKSQTKKFEVLNTTFTIDKSYSFNASIKSNSNEASNSSDSSHASDSINPSNTSNLSNSNGKENERIQTNTMIHNFSNASKISDYENIVYFVALGQEYHPLGLFKDKNLEELNFPTLFFGQPQNPI